MTQVASPAPSPSTGPPSGDGAEVAMTHRQVLEALSGLLLAMFVAMLSSTVVTNALPRIVADLDGTQTGYTWVVVATLLAMTATTPVWGKLADLFSKKMLVQLALVIFAIGSLMAALAPSMEILIGARVVQGLGVGGLTALVQVVIASMITPRERGRYSGYIGAVFALATVSGPLIGGLIVDSPLGWRGTFFVGLPFAVVAFVLLQKTLHLPVVKREVHIDYTGATLIVAGVSLLLVWVSLAGNQFDWVSVTSALLVVAGLLVVAAAVYVEARVAVEPVVPLRLFRDRTIALATTASVLIGVAMFGSTVYLSQYFQTARGMSPTAAGLMSIAMVGGLLVSSIVSGRRITTTGLWKRWLVSGMTLTVLGLGLLGTIDDTTDLRVVGLFMAVLGVGLGATMQNLVLAVQNNVPLSELGAASSVVAFFRSLGGSVGVSVLGALLSTQVATKVTAGLSDLGIEEAGHSSHEIPDLDALPAPVRAVFEQAFGESFGHIFLVATPLALLALVCVVAIREVPLRTTHDVVPVAPADSAPEATADLVEDAEVREAGGTATLPPR
ncbi:EmrB/QacA subfamily drug resistance transporter [Nocardioides marinisabuli]|uniref:EmrB/QacA subfamily drug resistance transporter n=1 Tax=Nocardioides marinisabuli TaxID=419476 RepID=A0A7Y9EYW6_9ACTN|nr:EmrB/QacA subfamily drug resistance transporter [Nocardioides marinisabuli]